jgi:hypothetical protein
MGLMSSRRRADAAKHIRANKAKAVQKRQAESMKRHGLKTPFPKPEPKVVPPKAEVKKDGALPKGNK